MAYYQSLVDSLSSDMRTWVDEIKKSVSKVAVSKVKVKFHLTHNGTLLDHLNFLIKSIAKEFSSYIIL